MERVHTKILQLNQTRLIDNIANPPDVVEELFEKNIFTEAMKQEVEAEKTKHGQVRKILDTVIKRGPRAFNIFYECLLETSNYTAADFLRPDLAGHHPHNHAAGERGHTIPQPAVDLPADWPNVQAMTADIRVIPCPVRSELVQNNWLRPYVYSMKKPRRGRCLILSNQTFYGPLEKDSEGVMRCILSTRHGAVKDEEDLKKLFTQLHFDVITRTNLTAQDIHSELLREAAHSDHSQAECFVCVICSHGNRNGIYGTDGKTISLENVTKYFDGDHCKHLQAKPKLFFIQACQGEGAHRSGSNVIDGGKDLSDQLEGTDKGDQTDETEETLNDTLDPNTIYKEADMLIAYPTHPGYVSIRHIQYGSWFIQAIIYVFQKYACKEEIFSLLNLVRNLVMRGRTALNQEGPRDVMQVPFIIATFRKKFFFFPGMAADSEPR